MFADLIPNRKYKFLLGILQINNATQRNLAPSFRSEMHYPFIILILSGDRQTQSDNLRSVKNCLSANKQYSSIARRESEYSIT